jgi:solute carrier family 35 protein E2
MNGETLLHRAMLAPVKMDPVRPAGVVVHTPGTVTTEGLFNIAAMTWLILWYLSSFLTLFMNKHTLDAFQAEPFLFSTIQIVVSTVFGAINMRYPCYMGRASKDCVRRPMKFYTSMSFVGLTRFLVVFLSLLSLEYVAVSFTETVKSSAPLFTVFISWLVLREQNGIYVQLSLLPIMTGLMLCSAYELSFTMIGFLAALGTNIAECVQFVLSKQSLSSLAVRTTPAEFQFYSCFASVIIQLPICLILMDYSLAAQTTVPSFIWMILNGFVYHIQSMTSWVLMEYVSPVTHSVCNTVKRAIAIWLSVLVYGNAITLLGGLGTVIVIIGVLLYNKARHYEQTKHHLIMSRSMSLEKDGIRQAV